MNDTIRKFGYPQTLVREYQHWMVLVRPKQVTVGSLVLACKDPARALSEISAEAFGELATVTKEMESALRRTFAPDKLNYLLLMMVDPDVHFHVIPRYASARKFEGLEFSDPAWPRPPDLARENPIGAEGLEALRAYLERSWGKNQ
jgi:diadenosine tetraphosphate (Ap4A) HIT family hydrolase